MEVCQFVQLGDVVPSAVRQPARARVVHLVVSVHHLMVDNVHTDAL